MSAIVSLLLPALALAAPAVVTPRQAFGARITSVDASGSGCPAGSFSINTSPDGSVTTLGFDAYQVHIGPGTNPADDDKFCNIAVQLSFPVGCGAATISSTYHGFTSLDAGVSGSFPTQYTLLSGGAGPDSPATFFAGGQAANVYTKQDNTAVTTNVGVATFTAFTRVDLEDSNGDEAGTLTVDDATFAIVGGC